MVEILPESLDVPILLGVPPTFNFRGTVVPSIYSFDFLYLQVKSSAGHRPRFDHCMEAIPICPGVTEVMLFGGCPQWPKNFRSYDDFPHMAETALARFGKLFVSVQ